MSIDDAKPVPIRVIRVEPIKSGEEKNTVPPKNNLPVPTNKQAYTNDGSMPVIKKPILNWLAMVGDDFTTQLRRIVRSEEVEIYQAYDPFDLPIRNVAMCKAEPDNTPQIQATGYANIHIKIRNYFSNVPLSSEPSAHTVGGHKIQLVKVYDGRNKILNLDFTYPKLLTEQEMLKAKDAAEGWVKSEMRGAVSSRNKFDNVVELVFQGAHGDY